MTHSWNFVKQQGLHMMMIKMLLAMKMTFQSETLKYSLAKLESIYCNKLSVCCQIQWNNNDQDQTHNDDDDEDGNDDDEDNNDIQEDPTKYVQGHCSKDSNVCHQVRDMRCKYGAIKMFSL